MTLQEILPEFKSLAQSMGGRPLWRTNEAQGGTSAWVESFTFSHGPVLIVSTRVAGAKGATIGARFSVDATALTIEGLIELRREAWYDRLGKALRINREIQLGDASFDRGIYVLTDLPNDAVVRILDAPVRQACGAIVDAGGSVVLTPAAVAAEIPLRMFARRDLIQTVLDDLVRVHEAVRVTCSSSLDPYGRANRVTTATPLRPRKLRAAACIGALAASIVLLCITDAPPTLSDTAQWLGLAVGMVIWFLGAVVIALMFRGRASSLQTVAVLVFPFIVLVPFGSNALRWLNAHLDGGPTTQESGTAWAVSPAKGPRTVLMILATSKRNTSARYGRLEVIPSESLLNSAPAPMIATLKPGAFGWEWVDHIEMTRP